ncbi:motility associated factor glycosyltransferase family protein [Clostridium magnum]|uniref:6-hydroxymethylpterin diphosphokinase MptE-like domain-containing protein n=1 Tax=Clostridium magnum DSM 2767 TaxID=1121326 RepID=A0A161XHE5_9CLOT|nr:6-hydroxymethylpterin diphosphokinase MptE-like protein [Clostridium magnum]KZL94086.1 hypothetical protein CLMAG_11390 [Clostridium magnum DSM 2767]SHH95249.1 Uncharacterized conserved protein [Clostridium magnum DSM 2767]
MKIYDNNLRYLKKNSLQIYDIITKEKDLYEVKISDLKEQDNCIVEKGEIKCYLHSIYDKIAECKKSLSQVNENTGTLILFGVGYGHVFRYLKKNALNIKHVIIIEPNIQLFKRFLKFNKIESLLKSIPKISFIVNKPAEEVALALEQMIGEAINTNIQFVNSITYVTLFNDYYNKMSKHIVEVLRRIRMNTSTDFHNTYRLLVNVMKNLKVQGYKMNRLSELLEKTPVIIVSAGPSLNKNMSILEEAKNKAVVIAVGTAIEILEQNNITPHFRAAFSPHVDTTIFKKLKNCDVPLIYTNNLYFDILPEYSGPKFRLIADSDILSRYVYDKAKIENKLVISELSIANIIFEYLCNIGCNDIILIGQDLAYKDNTMYAQGAINNINVNFETAGLIKDKDSEGKEIYTDSKFMGMRDALVRSMNRYQVDSQAVTNTSEGGLYIPSTTYMKLSDKLNKMEELCKLESEIQAIIQQEKNEQVDNLKDVVKVVYGIKKELQEIKEIAEERVTMLKKAVEMKDKGINPNEILKEYEKINKLEQNMLSIPFYDMVTKYQLHGNYSTTISAFKYDGGDQNKQVEALENILMRVGVELKSYFEIFEAVLSEYNDNFIEFNLLSQEEMNKLQNEEVCEVKEKIQEERLGILGLQGVYEEVTEKE